MGQHLKLLEGTVFAPAYDLFGVENDGDLIAAMNWTAIIFTVVVGIYSFIQPSPYGKFSQPWTGPTINAKVAWTIQELPAWLIPFVLIYQSEVHWRNSVPNVLLTVLFTCHYVHRSLIYPQRITGAAKPVPISTALLALVICTFNGLFQCHHLLNVEEIQQTCLFTSWVGLFILGMAINIYHDKLLIALKRDRTEEERQRSAYKIPQGGLFEYVSGANYFGEIIEWWGFAMASGETPQLIFAIFSSVFLGIRSWHQHQYYKRTFRETYPADRAAVIPFIF